MPREIRDLCIAANNSHILAFDNVSDMRPWISDALCRMSTGGGFAVRQLYTDQDEVLFDAVRPIILNGIESVVTRPDLADRSVVLSLKIVEPSARLPEKELWSKFDRDKPFILGGLLDSVARGLNDLPSTKLSSLPRMADFALWGQACEQTKGVFMKAYFGNREAVVDAVIEADVIATAVRDFIVDRGKWEGTMASLLSLLGAQVGDRVATSRGWPTSARGLSGALTRLSASLLRVGVTYTPPDRKKKAVDRILSLETARMDPPRQVQCVPQVKPNEINGEAGTHLGTHLEQQVQCVPPMCMDSPLKNNGNTHHTHHTHLGGPSFDPEPENLGPALCAHCGEPEAPGSAFAVCAHCAGEAEIGNDVEEWPSQPPLHADCRDDWLLEQECERQEDDIGELPAFLDRRNHLEE
jgi:hypothetical protein